MRNTGPPVRSLVRALAHRNFRLFCLGQGTSLVGTWMQQVAMSWLVYRLTGSPFLLGLVPFCGQIPAVFLAPLAGVLSDRWDRRRLVMATQALAMTQALLLAVLALSGLIAVWHILALSLFLGVVNVFDMTARQALTLALVDRKEDLPNAIALNSSLVNGARLVGPSLAGLVIWAAGEGVCFLLNGLSYLAVLAALAAMRLPPRPAPRPAPQRDGFRAGVAYAFGFTPIRDLLLLLALVNLAGTPYTVLLPVFATRVLHGGSALLGFLTAATGLGALAGAVYLAAQRSVVGLAGKIALTPALFGAGLMLFACSDTLWLSLPLLLAMGFTLMVQTAASNSVLQTIVDEDMRGRVMSFYTLALMGMTPLGSLIAGSLAGRIGAPATLLLGGPCCLVGALLFARRLPRLRRKTWPIYARLGLLPGTLPSPRPLDIAAPPAEIRFSREPGASAGTPLAPNPSPRRGEGGKTGARRNRTTCTTSSEDRP